MKTRIKKELVVSTRDLNSNVLAKPILSQSFKRRKRTNYQLAHLLVERYYTHSGPVHNRFDPEEDRSKDLAYFLKRRRDMFRNHFNNTFPKAPQTEEAQSLDQASSLQVA